MFINGKLYSIEKFVGGDMKFLGHFYGNFFSLIIFLLFFYYYLFIGITGANSYQPCIFCTWDYRSEHLKDNRAQYPPPIPRTLLIAKQKVNGTDKVKDGYSHLPIADCIDFDHCVFDILHMVS